MARSGAPSRGRRPANSVAPGSSRRDMRNWRTEFNSDRRISGIVVMVCSRSESSLGSQNDRVLPTIVVLAARPAARCRRRKVAPPRRARKGWVARRFAGGKIDWAKARGRLSLGPAPLGREQYVESGSRYRAWRSTAGGRPGCPIIGRKGGNEKASAMRDLQGEAGLRRVLEYARLEQFERYCRRRTRGCQPFTQTDPRTFREQQGAAR